ncbi:MAG TPA: FeoA family protein [Propionibacteriaceae bacterium]|nr:FeoA family protein [Propionibacteriaceae bacterium]
MSTAISLASARVGTSLTLLRAEGSPELCRRLSALGLRRGARVRIVNPTPGGGRVISVAGSRIAMDASMLKRLFAEEIPA